MAGTAKYLKYGLWRADKKALHLVLIQSSKLNRERKMNEPSISAMTTYLGWVVVSVLQGLHPGAACGAAFGCFFFVSFPDPDRRPLIRKTALLVFSWGWGYSFGDAVSKSEHWSNWAMVSAVTAAAMAATVFGVINLMVANNGPVPKWVEFIVDRVPFLKSRNTDEPK